MVMTDLFLNAKVNELALLGAALMQPNNAILISSEIKEDWILNSDMKKLYSVIRESIGGKDTQLNLISEKGLARVAAEAMEYAYFSSSEIKAGLAKCRENYTKFNLQRIGESINPDDPKNEVPRLLLELEGILDSFDGEESDSEALIRLYEDMQKEYKEKILSGKDLIGYSCGIKKIDDVIDGLRQGHLWVIGGYTSAGKTFFALNIVDALLEQKVKVSIYSLEMSKEDVVGRLIGMRSEIPSVKIMKGDLEDGELLRVREAKERFKGNLFVHSEKSDLSEIMASMQLSKIRDGVEVFVLDYAQLVHDRDSDQYNTLRKLSIQLQHFCRKNKVSMIMLSQVSNDSAKNPNPFVMGFKGSGEIAASADLAIELTPDESPEDRELKIKNREPFAILASIKKNRHGPVRQIGLEFQGIYGRFKQDDF